MANVDNRVIIHLDQVIDDVTFTRRDMSFIYKDNKHLNSWLAWMLTQVALTEEGRRLWLEDGWWDVNFLLWEKLIRKYMCANLLTSKATGERQELPLSADAGALTESTSRGNIDSGRASLRSRFNMVSCVTRERVDAETLRDPGY